MGYRALSKQNSFLSNGISIKDLIILVMCFTLFFAMISYIWTVNELIHFINKDNAEVLVVEFLKYMLYIILCFVVPYVVAVTYYFLSEKNANGIAKILDSMPNIANNIKVTSSNTKHRMI
jgi:uncharacterized membrane protein